MKLEQVIISGDMPINCGYCLYGEHNYRFINDCKIWECSILGNRAVNNPECRPEWCPLVKESESQ